MGSRVKQSGRVDAFCPECMTCFEGRPQACTECGAPAPRNGWPDIQVATHPYLGKIVDDRYLLDQYVGGGASGRVYRARDLKLDRPFALKILDLSASGGTSTESSLRRFENEVEALSRIRNPHVINIYESYRLEGETPAMLTEYIEGLTLAEMLEGQRRLEVDSALTLIRQVANGLQEAHRRGVIHRDLKPANIMVEKLPAAGSFARMLDFGLVHLSDEAGETRGFWGTPLYAAPEQCSPGPPITAATDVYSLGCVIFHCVAGQPPFPGDDPRVIMRAHVDEPPPRLADVADQHIPDQVDEVVAEMLEKNPENRPSEMSSVVAALEAQSRSSGAWDRSVVVQESSDLEVEDERESRKALELDEKDTSPGGTRIGVADTNPKQPRIAQLLESVDLEEKLSEFSGTVVETQLDRSGDCAVVADSEARVSIMSTKGESYFQELASADGRVLALVSDIVRGQVFAVQAGSAIVRWRLRSTGSRPSQILQTRDRAFSIALGDNGQTLYVGTESGEVLRHDLRVERTRVVAELPGTVTALHAAADSDRLLGATLDGGVYAIREGDETPPVQLASFDGDVRSLELSHEERIATAVGDSSDLRFFHLRGSLGGVTVTPDVEGLRTVGMVPSGEILAVAVSDPEVRIWRIRRERIENRLPDFEAPDCKPTATRQFGHRREQ